MANTNATADAATAQPTATALKAVISSVRRATSTNGDFLIIGFEEFEVGNTVVEPRSLIHEYSEQLESKWKKRIGKSYRTYRA